VAKTIKECCGGFLASSNEYELILTGQAESLVILGENGKPLRNAISWMDERSWEECRELGKYFGKELCYKVTGQVSFLPTWPITKILWIKRNEPWVFNKVYKYLLIKDYIQYRLTGKIFGEYSIYNFSLYFDINKKDYWKDMLTYCSVRDSQLPQLIEPCTNIGELDPSIADDLGIPKHCTVNVGTIDQFASMIGMGNIKPGIVSESTGTVLSIATLVNERPSDLSFGIPCHYGPFKDSFVLLSVCESGGINLEWAKDNFLPNSGYEQIEEEIKKKIRPGEIIFLPYLTGVNAPNYDENAKGVFYGLRIKHDKFDLILAVMEGIAFMLADNISVYKKLGINVDKIISTGGGSRSNIWSQIKADISGCDIILPAEKETACFGAAIIGAVDRGIYPSFPKAIEDKVRYKSIYKSLLFENYSVRIQFYNHLDSIMRNYIWTKDNQYK